MFKARTRSVTGKSITHQINDIEKQVNDRARAAAPQVILPALYLVLSSLEKKFLYVFSVDKELSVVERGREKVFVGERSNSTVKHTGVFFKGE